MTTDAAVADNLDNASAATPEIVDQPEQAADTQPTPESQPVPQEPPKKQEPQTGLTPDVKPETTATSVQDDTSADTPEKGFWPDDWRARMAGGDEKLMKQLERFASPEDVYKSFRASQAKISSGEFKKTLPDNPTPEQLTEWRKDNGIPETPDKYDLGDIKVGDAERPQVDEFLKTMHGINASNETVRHALDAYYRLTEQAQAAQSELDAGNWQKTEDALRDEYGPEYRRNMNVVQNFMATLPEDFRDNLYGARLADGTKLMGSTEGIKFMLGLALDKNPAATILPHSSNPGADLMSEKAALEKRMGSAEWAKDKAAQNRYLQIVDMIDRIGLQQ